MFQPARLKRASVASCRLPLGKPSRSLLATGHLRDVAGRFNWARETAHGAFMANQAIALDGDAKQQRVIVAIDGCGDDTKAIAAGFALHPELLAGAAPEGDKAGFQSPRVTDLVQKAQHQHFAGERILDDSGHKSIHLVEVYFRSRVAHSFILSERCRKAKSPPA